MGTGREFLSATRRNKQVKSIVQEPSSTCLGLGQPLHHGLYGKTSTARLTTFTMLLLFLTDKATLPKSRNIISSLLSSHPRAGHHHPELTALQGDHLASGHALGQCGVGATHPGPRLPVPAAGFFLSLPPLAAAVLELSAQPTVLGNSSCI